jgi:transcriptional regulator with XRE-family HTH domain
VKDRPVFARAHLGTDHKPVCAHLSTQSFTNVYSDARSAVACARMPKALKSPQFGAWLRKQRGDKTLEEFAILIRRHAKAFGLEFDRSQVVKLEGGRVPSLPILWALAPVLECSVVELEQRISAELRGERVGRDLPDHSTDQGSDFSGGKNADVPAPSRLQQEHDDLLRATTEVASHMLQALAALSEQGIRIPVLENNARPRTRKPSVRARARKSG